MVKEFTIELSQSSFVAGSTVCGLLVVKVNEPKRYKKITVYLKGQAKWKTVEETYTCQESVVWESSHSFNGLLSTGCHTFPFQFTIPSNCPSSFRDEIGIIEYIIAGKIESESFFQNEKVHVIRHVINVLGFVDTSCQATQEPVVLAKEQCLGRLCFPQETVTYSLSLPCSLFCVGEDLQTRLEVENESGHRLKIKLYLVEKIEYITPRKHRPKTNVIMVQETSLEPHKTSYWNSENFIVPAIRPAIVGSNIFKSEYFVHIVAKFPWSLKIISDSSMTIPVVIGNARETDCNPQTTAYDNTLDHNPPVFETVHDYPPAVEPPAVVPPAVEPSSYWN